MTREAFEQETLNLLAEHRRQHPALEPRDEVKFLFQGLRISYYIKEGAVAAEEFSHRRRTLYAEGGFVVAALYLFPDSGRKNTQSPSTIL